MRVLLIEDDPHASRSISMILTRASFNVSCAVTGEEGINLAKIYGYDLIVLDLMLPDIEGYEVLRRLRSSRIKTPVLVLSGADNAGSKIKGFASGADDYLIKPFRADELIARIKAIVRRSAGYAQSMMYFADLTINLDTKEVSAAGQLIELTGKEYSVLELLALRRGSTITREMLLDHLYGGLDEPEIKIIGVFICRIRKKLAAATRTRFIDTVWGRGYVFFREPGCPSVA